jgi:hypothetical protein
MAQNVYELLGIKPPQGQSPAQQVSPATTTEPQPAAPQSAPTPPAPSFREMVERNPGGVIGAGTGTMAGYGLTPKTSVMPGTTLLRAAPGVIRNPLSSGGVSAVTEGVSQAAEMGVGAREEFDPLQIGLAAAIPPAFSVATAIPAAVKRTVTRLLPGRFAAAHEGAQASGRRLVKEVAPAEGAVAEFGAKAAQASEELVPATTVMQTVTSPKFSNLNRLVKPTSEEAGAVKDTMKNLNEFLNPDGTMPLGGLEAIREDIGRKAAQGWPRIKQIYGSIVQDLENAAAAGGPGAQAARDMAEAYKQTLGAKSIEKAITDATFKRTIGSADVDVLNIGKFAQAIHKQRADLTKQIGPEGMALIDDFVTRFRSLPPANANTAWNAMLATVGGGVGAISGTGLAGAAGTALGVEFVRNLLAVARTPGAWSRIMATAAQAARGPMGAAPESAED